MSRLQSALLVLLAYAIGWASPAMAVEESELLPVDEAFRLKARAPDREHVELTWQIAEGYYLYRERIKISAQSAAVTLGEPVLPQGTPKHDEFFGDVQTYRGTISVRVPFTLADPLATMVALKVASQGCADVGVCYPPHKMTVAVELPDADASAAVPPTADNPLARALSASAPVMPGAGTESLPLPAEQAFQFEAIVSQPDSLLARFTMPKGYYLYRDKTKVLSVSAATDGAALAVADGAQWRFDWPAGVAHKDEHFGDVVVYFDQVEVPILVPRTQKAAQRVEAQFEFQGCQLDGICYPPMQRRVSLDFPAASAITPLAVGVAKAAPSAAALGSDEDRLSSALDGSIWLAAFLYFGFGLLLAFTPCVFPLIPILSGIIAGAGEHITTRRAFVLSLVYVLANAVVFALAGVIAGLAGKNLQAAFQEPWVLTAFALLFVAFAFSMFGFYELQMPARWQTRLGEISNRQKAGSLWGVAVMGALSALIVGPCVTPPLAVAVGKIAETGSPLVGGIALFSLGLGMGAPLIAFGVGEGKLLPRAGAWMDAVKNVFGVMFLFLAIWMLERFLDPTWIMLLSGGLLVGCAMYLGALERLPERPSGWHTFRKALGVVLFLLGLMQLIGAMAGGRDALQPLKGLAFAGTPAESAAHLQFTRVKSVADVDREIGAATQAGKAVMLDFYADWCVSCKEMEKYTFSEAAVQSALAGRVLLKANVTANDELDDALLKRYGLIGPPATLFFGRDGQEHRAARLLGFEEADKFALRASSTN